MSLDSGPSTQLILSAAPSHEVLAISPCLNLHAATLASHHNFHLSFIKNLFETIPNAAVIIAVKP